MIFLKTMKYSDTQELEFRCNVTIILLQFVTFHSLLYIRSLRDSSKICQKHGGLPCGPVTKDSVLPMQGPVGFVSIGN